MWNNTLFVRKCIIHRKKNSDCHENDKSVFYYRKGKIIYVKKQTKAKTEMSNIENSCNEREQGLYEWCTFTPFSTTLTAVVLFLAQLTTTKKFWLEFALLNNEKNCSYFIHLFITPKTSTLNKLLCFCHSRNFTGFETVIVFN